MAGARGAAGPRGRSGAEPGGVPRGGSAPRRAQRRSPPPAGTALTAGSATFTPRYGAGRGGAVPTRCRYGGSAGVRCARPRVRLSAVICRVCAIPCGSQPPPPPLAPWPWDRGGCDRARRPVPPGATWAGGRSPEPTHTASFGAPGGPRWVPAVPSPQTGPWRSVGVGRVRCRRPHLVAVPVPAVLREPLSPSLTLAPAAAVQRELLSAWYKYSWELPEIHRAR